MESGFEKGKEVIRAAGGIVWADYPDARRLIVVHRSERYGDEWILPKGKLDAEDKSWMETALREVVEETKLPKENIRIDDLMGSICYETKDGPKVILFWNMMFTGSSLPISSPINDPQKEIDGVKWVTIEEALDLLRYPKERALLRDTSVIPNQKPKATLFGGIMRRIKRISNNNSSIRLEAEIGPFEIDLMRISSELLCKKNAEKNAENIDNWNRKLRIFQFAFQHVKRAKESLYLGEIELGWRHFHQAELTRIYLEDDEQTLSQLAIATLNESKEKLSLWRKDTVIKLLCDDKQKIKSPLSVDENYTAKKILYEDHDNTYNKLKRVQFQLVILTLTGFFCVTAIALTLINLGNNAILNNPALIRSIIFFGALGGIVSGIFTISTGSTKAKIPNQILNSWLTILRPLLGAMSALAATVFLLSGIINFNNLSVPLILAISFGAGFSERLVIGSVEKIAP